MSSSSSSYHGSGQSGLTSPSPGRLPVSPAASVASGAVSGGHSPAIGNQPPSHSPNAHVLPVPLLGCGASSGSQIGSARSAQCPVPPTPATYNSNEFVRKPASSAMYDIVELPEDTEVTGLFDCDNYYI